MLLTSLGLNVQEYLERQNGKKVVTFQEKQVPTITVTMKQLEERAKRMAAEDNEKNGPQPKIILVKHRDDEWERLKRKAQASWELHHQIKEQNKKNKDNFPKCENCFKTCYLSGHATKTVCQKEPLHYCYKCYNTELEVLSEYRNRRRCPNHVDCVAFESKSDRKKYNNEDEEWTNYFRDPTTCENHPEIKLVIPDRMLCYICDEDDTDIQLLMDEREQNLYQIAAIVGVKYFQEKEPENIEKQGAILDAFYMKDTKLQAEVKENKRKWEIARKAAEEVFDTLIPEDYFWIRKKIKELNQLDQMLFEIQKLQEENVNNDEIKVCMGCLNIEPQNALTYDPDLEWICRRCIPGMEKRKLQPEHDNDFSKRISRGYRQRENKRQKSRISRGLATNPPSHK